MGTKVKDWTSQEEALLRRLWMDGVDIETIAAQIGRTTKACRVRASQGLKLRRPPMVRRFVRKSNRKRAEVQCNNEYIDCMPNPFDSQVLVERGFDINFYRHK